MIREPCDGVKDEFGDALDPKGGVRRLEHRWNTSLERCGLLTD
jgi:hypothetical protein